MTNKNFNMVDLKDKHEKPFVRRFIIRRIFDDNPDLSYLEQDYHECGPVDSAKYQAQDRARLEAYNNGEWVMKGVRAECEYLIPVNSVPPSYIIQTLTSGGLWGIESDSDEEYFKSVEQEELDQLKDYCTTLGIQFDGETPVDYEDH